MVGKTATGGTGGKDIRQALLVGGFITLSQAKEIDNETKVSGRTFEEVVIEKKYILEATLGTVQKFLHNAVMGRLVTVNPVGTAAQREVAALVVKNLVAHARGVKSNGIYLIPVGDRTDVFLEESADIGVRKLIFFTTLSAPPFSELFSEFKAAGLGSENAVKIIV